MHKIVLYYNDTAGNYQLGDEKLTALLNDYGYHVIGAAPIEKGFELIDNKNEDLIVIAGGDGSIKNICIQLAKKNNKKRKLAILPFGTANNIALHLGYKLKSTLPLICKKWDKQNYKNYDLGICCYQQHSYYFVEAFGIGLFPALIHTMENMNYTPKLLPSDEIKIAIKKLYKSMYSTEGLHYKIIVNDTILEEKYLLIEVMNIRSIGPRWEIAPDADCGDGLLDLVCISANQKPILLKYLKLLAGGKKVNFPFKTIRAKKIKIIPLYNHSMKCHIDDQLLEISDPYEVNITTEPSIFNFLV